MSELVFVTPAWKRYNASRICFSEQAWVIKELAKFNINARSVVISDDDNLEIARELGFYTVEQNNRYLGQKFNDGIEWAFKNGADYIVPIGSDSWIHPDYFAYLTTMLKSDESVLTATNYSVVSSFGDVRADLKIEYHGMTSGVGPYVFPRKLLEKCEGRPAEDRMHRGIDYSTVSGIEKANGEPIRWVENDIFPCQYVQIRTPGMGRQLSKMDILIERYAVHVEEDNPLEELSKYYPAFLIEKLEVLYKQRRIDYA